MIKKIVGILFGFSAIGVLLSIVFGVLSIALKDTRVDMAYGIIVLVTIAFALIGLILSEI